MKNQNVVWVLLLLCVLPGLAMAQKGKTGKAQDDTSKTIAPYQDSLRVHELTLRDLGDSMVDGVTQTRRFKSAKLFIPALVKTLKFPGSYYYPFDSLGFMKKLEPDDHNFRILNWALKCNDGTYRYFGAIQYKSDDKLKLTALRCDTGSYDDGEMDTVVSGADRWPGALYYKIITTKIKGQTYYTLLGWDGFTYASDKKMVDVLSFDQNGKPIFGAPIFDVNGKTKDRVIFYYSGNTTMLLNYVSEHNLITFDHLVPPNPANTGVLYTYVPDGSYDYLELKNGKWTLKENLFKNFKKPIRVAGD
jgi:hypothetical protein